MRIAILDDYQGVALSVVDWHSSLPCSEIVALDGPIPQSLLADELAGFDVVVLMRERTPLSGALLSRLRGLRLLVTTGPSNAAIDLEAARELGIPVCGTRGTGQGTVELTWGLILSLARDIVRLDGVVRAGGWQDAIGIELRGRTLGIVGLGTVGKGVADIGKAFGMNILAWSPHMTMERAMESDSRAVSLNELLKSSDFVSIHLALSDETRGLIGRQELRRMRRSAYLINTSRGPIIDASALRSALESGWISGAGIDVYDVEPLPAEAFERRFPKSVLTPHIGYVTQEAYAMLFADVLDDILAFVSGHPIRRLV